MAVTLETEARNAACDAIVDLLDAGTIEFQTSGGVEVATCTFGTPAFGAAAIGVATANAITSDATATGGTIAKAVINTSVPAVLMTCSVTVTGDGGDFTGASLTIGAGDTVNVTALTMTMPAS
jgi:hypothetical protein